MLDAYAAHRTSSLSFFVAPAATLSNPYDTAIQLKRDGRHAARVGQGSRARPVEGMGRMRGRTRGGSPARSVVAGGAGGQRLSRGWTRRVFCRTSFALSTPLSVPSSPLLSPPIYNADWPRPRMHDPALPPRALSRSAASTSTSTTADRRVTEEPLPFRGSTSSILARAR